MRKSLALLVYLRLAGRAVARESLAALFWPEFNQQHALANLRRALSSLNKSLQNELLEADREKIGFKDRKTVWLDVEEYQGLLAAPKNHVHLDGAECPDCLQRLEQAAGLYQGDFLDGFSLGDSPEFDEWQTLQGENLRREYAGVLQRLAERYAAGADWERAIGAARRWVALDRLHEPAQRMLIQLLQRTSQRAAAVKQYEEFTRILQEELGQKPAPETAAFFQRILAEKAAAPPAGAPEFPGASGGLQALQPLLKTKLYIPSSRKEKVFRGRLIQALDQIEQVSLVVISAPAGFGKTTALVEWISQTSLPVAWYALDSGDNEAGRFLAYLVAALESTQGNFGLDVQSLLRAPQANLLQFVLTHLLHELEQLQTPLVLVLDDYQFISSQAIHEAVSFFLDHLPSHIHVIIATRVDPPLRLARLRSLGQLLEIRTKDLRFSSTEAFEYLNQVMGLPLGMDDVCLLDKKIEGWIAGLQMAALSMREQKDLRRFIEGFSGTNRYILDYLLEEVLASQTPEIQRFLLCTSILERLNAALCDSIMEDAEDRSRLDGRSAAILDHLDQANLFLLPLDDEHTWYRYHHLFADLLHARLQRTQPGQIRLLHLRASAWLEQNGLIPEAIRHLFEAGEVGRAADLIERHGPSHLALGDPSVLQMAGRLPPEVIFARPKIGLYQTWFFIIKSRLDQAHPLLHDLSRRLAGENLAPGQRWMQTVIASALAFLPDPTGAPSSAPLPDYELLNEIPVEESILRDVTDLLYGMALARRQGLDRAVEVSLKSLQEGKKSRGVQTVPTLVSFLTRLTLMQGDLHACVALCREHLDPIREKGLRFSYTAGAMKVDLGEVLLEWNCLDEAERYLREGLQDNQLWQNIMTDGFGMVALARLLRAKGDHAVAMQVVEKLVARMSAHAQPAEFNEEVRTLKARGLLAGGDIQGAVNWADQVLQGEDFALHPNYYRLVLARLRLAQGRFAEVEKILAGNLPPLATGSRIARKLESNLLLAAAMAGQQRLPEAFGLLESCLALAEPQGYIRVFLEAGEPLFNLLRRAVQQGVWQTDPPRQFIDQLLRSFEEAQSRA